MTLNDWNLWTNVALGISSFDLLMES